MKCTICGKQGPENKFSQEAFQLWDWFTGYLKETVHFCPLHKDSPERHALFARSQQRPAPAASKPAQRAERKEPSVSQNAEISSSYA
jgi:hypothetical protein